MPLYLVERTFTFENGLGLPDPEDSLKAHLGFHENNAVAGVSWIHSYVTHDNSKSFCLYDGPSSEAVRQAMRLNGLLIDRITEVHIQAPYAIASMQASIPLHIPIEEPKAAHERINP